MRSKFSALRPSHRPATAWIFATLLFLIAGRSLPAQTPPLPPTAPTPPTPPTPAGSPADAEPDLRKLRAEAETQAHLRVWNLLPKDGGTFDVAPPGGDATTARAVAVNLAPGQFADYYQTLPPGNYRLSVFRAGDRTTPLAEVPAAALARNTYHTLLLIPGVDHEHPQPLLVNDTYPYETTPTGQLFVWQGFDGAVANVTVGTERRERIPAHEARLFENLPVGNPPIPLLIQVRKPDNKLVDYRLTVTFDNSRRAALLILPDRFDRVRPRVVLSGEIVPPAARRTGRNP